MSNIDKKTIGVFLHALHYGGIEKFIETHRDVYNPQVNDCHIVVNRASDEAQVEYFESLGFTVHLVPMKSPKRVTMAAMEGYRRLFDELSFDVVHCNLPTNILPLQQAEKFGVDRKVIHSHSNYLLAISKMPQAMQVGYRLMMEHNANRADVCLACSKEAARVFGKNEARTQILNNSIEFASFAFDAEARVAVRRRLGIDREDNVFLHVGRMENDIKNHRFLLEVFKAWRERDLSAKLVLVGDGKKRVGIEAYATELGVRDSCLFVGTTNNVGEYLSAADLFLFPSKTEGLGISLVEAQASGLPCVASDRVPRKAGFMDNVLFEPIDVGVDSWVVAIEDLLSGGRVSVTKEIIAESGFSVDESSAILRNALGL